MRLLTPQQKNYVELRLSGIAPTEAATTAGYKHARIAACKLEKTPMVATALISAVNALQPCIPKISRIPTAPKIPETEIMTLEELCWFLSEMVRELSYPPQVRLAAGKILSDVRQFGNPNQPQTGISLNLGVEEKKL